MMKIDLIGRIANIPLGQHRPLLPLFEAVVNSIQAIRARAIKDGQIDIEVERDETQALISETQGDTRPITDFRIVDNGIGFNDENFESFTTSDTKYKRGAKGIGRFMWLKAFELVRVTSTYVADGDMKERTFDFRLSRNGIEHVSVSNAFEWEPRTEVNLVAYKEKYQKPAQGT